MAHQVADEALYSATYVKNYLDSVENLPDDVQRLLSRIRDIDVQYRSHLRDVDHYYDQWRITSSSSSEASANKRVRPYMACIKQKLIAAQELGDEKLQIVGQLQDLIDQKTRQLDVDFKNLDYGKEEPLPETPQKVPRPATPVIQTPLTTKVENQTFPLSQQNPQRGSTPTNQSVDKTSNNNGNERSSNKRSRRPRNESHNTSATDAGSLVENNLNNDSITPAKQNNSTSTNQGNNSVSTSATSQKKGSNSGGGGGGGKKKKRKARGTASNNQSNVRDDTPPPEEPIDPDEPTYCLCDQISFGEMILCDNDLCPIEWFHFSCVSLSSKPKGKWYCPNCRGDRPNIMKPKAQFLKELERYNKEKEEKT